MSIRSTDKSFEFWKVNLEVFRIQTLEYGLELILQYLNKITPDKYRPLLKEVLKEQRICGIIASVLAIAPQGNTRIIL